MPLELRTAAPEDALRVIEIEHLAYKDDPVTPILFPGPFPDDAREARAKQIADQLKGDPSAVWTKVVDTDTGEMIAFSSWNVSKPGDPTAPKERRQFGPGCNIPACEEFWAPMYANREKYMGGRPHVYLNVLLTDPKHQRKGAGRMLVNWGLKIADELKLPAFLDSSPYGHKLYLDSGFEDVDKSVFDSTKYGGQVTNTIWYMERPVST